MIDVDERDPKIAEILDHWREHEPVVDGRDCLPLPFGFLAHLPRAWVIYVELTPKTGEPFTLHLGHGGAFSGDETIALFGEAEAGRMTARRFGGWAVQRLRGVGANDLTWRALHAGRDGAPGLRIVGRATIADCLDQCGARFVRAVTLDTENDCDAKAVDLPALR